VRKAIQIQGKQKWMQFVTTCATALSQISLLISNIYQAKKDAVYVRFFWNMMVLGALVAIQCLESVRGKTRKRSEREKKSLMSEWTCNKICRYFAADSGRVKTAIYKKWCSKCEIHLISKYFTCPCCHSMLVKV
jgi:hypothetical protein